MNFDQDQESKLLVKRFEDFTSSIMPQLLQNQLQNQNYNHNLNPSLRRNSSIQDLLNVEESQFFRHMRGIDPTENENQRNDLSENSINKKNLNSINGSKSLLSDQESFQSNDHDFKLFEKFRSQTSKLKQVYHNQGPEQGQYLTNQLLGSNFNSNPVAGCTTNHYNIQNLNFINSVPPNPQNFLCNNHTILNNGIDIIMHEQRNIENEGLLFEQNNQVKMSDNSDENVSDNPLRFGCWSGKQQQVIQKKKINDTTFSLPVIQDKNQGIIRLKSEINIKSGKEKKPKSECKNHAFKVDQQQFQSPNRKENSKAHSKSKLKNFAQPQSIKKNGQNITQQEAQILKFATKNLFEGQPESVRKIILHKVKIIKKNGKTIRKPIKIVIRRSTKSFSKTNQRQDSNTQILVGRKSQSKQEDLSKIKNYKIKSAFKEKNLVSRQLQSFDSGSNEQQQICGKKKRQENSDSSSIIQSQTSNQLQKQASAPYQFYEQQRIQGQNLSNNSQNHVHHHHHYYFNKTPQITGLNLDYNQTDRAKSYPKVFFDDQSHEILGKNQDSEYLCDFHCQSHSSRSKSDFQSYSQRKSTLRSFKQSDSFKQFEQKESGSRRPKAYKPTDQERQDSQKSLLENRYHRSKLSSSIEQSLIRDFDFPNLQPQNKSFKNQEKQKSKLQVKNWKKVFEAHSTDRNFSNPLNSSQVKSYQQFQINSQQNSERTKMHELRKSKKIRPQGSHLRPESSKNNDQQHQSVEARNILNTSQFANLQKKLSDQLPLYKTSQMAKNFSLLEVIRQQNMKNNHQPRNQILSYPSAMEPFNVKLGQKRLRSPICFEIPENHSPFVLFELQKVQNHHQCPKKFSLERIFLEDFYQDAQFNRLIRNQTNQHENELKPKQIIDQQNQVLKSDLSRVVQVLNVDRYLKVRRFWEKRQKRMWQKKSLYEVRQSNAQKRPRINGRFIKKDELKLPVIKKDKEKRVKVLLS